MQNFNSYTKQKWNSLYPADINPISSEQLDRLKAFNDQIDVTDVQQVYLPLVYLLNLTVNSQRQAEITRAEFLQEQPLHIPFIVGISGSVAVGKSTTARLLQYLCETLLPNRKTQSLTTDGFLYPNQVLKQRGLLASKGFPASYDMPALIEFLKQVKSGAQQVQAPVYSHQSYDIIPDQHVTINNPDILILEGINTLQLPADQNVFISDFTDFSIYIDADTSLIKQWYLNRFQQLRKTAFTDPNNYFNQYAKYDLETALMMAVKTWKTINLPNLERYILPTRPRANLIIHKGEQHRIDRLYLRQY
ncbi:type I pantothenate kinase [Fructilactobacillus florum]|uniref:Pantothenate kinase n=1 Tax=Fructilactobacillus florum DSM 22689 = JCM 16035 TaxID=1423745 RepID=A0A0R2CGU6_9LACO|nr:type I pantothenate kinase [Fructilactobacillus florum]KRM90522.1 Pantothenate kinase [Fructilactobacillus florum DSM 22689 = JCM 16035]